MSEQLKPSSSEPRQSNEVAKNVTEIAEEIGIPDEGAQVVGTGGEGGEVTQSSFGSLEQLLQAETTDEILDVYDRMSPENKRKLKGYRG